MTSGTDNSKVDNSYIDWTEKYRPRNLSGVVGNKKAKNELKRWAGKWISEKPDKKAVILAGKPGIGKTTSALALAEEMGWGVLEMNASDDRNSDAIKNFVGRSAVDDTFSVDGDFIPYNEGKRTLLILDEADNVFGSQDRGGIREIVNTIKKTQQPIVLIANDYYDLRRRSEALSRMCKKIEFEPVNKGEIISLLQSICKNEGIKYEQKALQAIADRSDGDVRSAVRDLESVSTGKDRIRIDDIGALGFRNREAEIFPSLKTILQKRDPIEAKRSVRYLNEEPGNLIVWIDENMPREYGNPKDLSNGYFWLSKSDLYLGRVMKGQSYSFWSYATDMMTAGVSIAKDSSYTGWTRYAFPTWIRKMSNSKGKRSMRRTLSIKIAEGVHTTSNRSRLDVLPYFKNLFKNDVEFRKKMVKEFDFKPSESAFLLDSKTTSKMVKNLYKEEKEEKIKKKKEEIDEKKEKQSSDQDSEDEESEEDKGQKSLLEF